MAFHTHGSSFQLARHCKLNSDSLHPMNVCHAWKDERAQRKAIYEKVSFVGSLIIKLAVHWLND